MKAIEERGGFIQCYKDGWVEKRINEARYRYADGIESSQLTVVGVNKFVDEEEDVRINIFRHGKTCRQKE